MSTLFAATLIIHVIAGVVAVGMHNVVLMHLLKPKTDFVFVARTAWWAVALFFLSWATAAYYYVEYYGGKVKPRILAGDMPAAHAFFMETKEHVFLLLPFLAIVIALGATYLRTHPDEGLKRATTLAALIALGIGAFSVISGIFISGSI